MDNNVRDKQPEVGSAEFWEQIEQERVETQLRLKRRHDRIMVLGVVIAVSWPWFFMPWGWALFTAFVGLCLLHLGEDPVYQD